MDTLLLCLLLIPAYLAAAALLFRRLTGGSSPPGITKRTVLLIALAAVALHAVVLYQQLFTPDGINFGFFNTLSLLTWVIALLLVLTAFERPVENLGIAVFPLAAIASVLEAIFPSTHILSPQRNILDVHILISITAYSILSLAAVQAILVAIQDKHLHEKHPGGFIRALPPLQSMESLLFQMIGVGFVMQSLSLISGFVYLDDMFAQHLVHKTFFSILAWLVFAILLWGRWKFGWRGKIAIRWTLGGFVSLLLAYLGSKLVLELMLGQP
ncbi:MAG: cytochrome c biogenesis protein CcsA [Gammaproteobacteria bacterium]|nr:cytochrome c biogenesis protein CcsA [Gammaproteobacteria bacterium]